MHLLYYIKSELTSTILRAEKFKNFQVFKKDI